MASDEVDTSRVSVKTYIPEYQKEQWEEHAEELDMSRSEYIRSMVQAGRRGFLESETEQESGAGSDDGFEARLYRIIRDEGPIDWEGLRTELTGDIEEALEESLQELQSQNEVQYSGRAGGYMLSEDDGR